MSDCFVESLRLSGADSHLFAPWLGWKAQPSSRAKGLVGAEASERRSLSASQAAEPLCDVTLREPSLLHGQLRRAADASRPWP